VYLETGWLKQDAPKVPRDDGHPDIAMSMADLAVTYHQRNMLAEAETLGLSVLAGRKRVLGDKYTDTL
jgi:hypothetical protein